MKLLSIVLGIFVYFIIGGVIAKLLDENDGDWILVCVFFWPMVAGMFMVAGFAMVVTKISSRLANVIFDFSILIVETIGEWFSNLTGKEE